MTDTDPAPPADQLVERLFGATLNALELLSVYLGWRLHLYRTLDDHGPLTYAGLAEAAGIDGRYACEWLEQQAAAGFLTVDDASAGDADRRYSMPAGYRGVLVDGTDLSHVAPFASMIVGIAGALPEVAAAYRTGEGVPFARYGVDMRQGQGAINRPAFTHDLAGWIETMGDIHQRLSEGAGARVVDLGCGQGWSTVALARAYPNAEVIGIDTDQPSIVEATVIASTEGVEARFLPADAAGLDGTADLVCIFEALHDMSQPVQVLEAARRQLAPGGVVLVADERVGDTFSAPAGEVERMMYGWSVLHCLPACRAESPSAALGTVLRRPALETLAAEAGFISVEVLDIENDFFRFYRLNP